MNFSASIKSIADRITPFIEKRSEKAAHPNRIHFSKSDIPADMFGELPSEVAPDATVAPFAQSYLHPDLLGMKPAVNGISKMIESTRTIIGKIEDERTRNSFNKLYTMILDNKADLPKETNRLTNLVCAVDRIENPKVRGEILDNIDRLTDRDPKKFKNFYENTMGFAEDYSDAVNAINGMYLDKNNGVHKFYKKLNKKGIWYLDIIDGVKKDEKNYRKKLLTNSKKIKEYSVYCEAFDNFTKKGLKQTYENNLAMEAMRNFFDVYYNTRPEAIKTLYHEEYLKTLPPKVAKECADVQKEYETYIITSNHDITPKDIKYVKEELRMWKEAGKEEAIMPAIIDVNAFDEYLLKTHRAGYAQPATRKIGLRELLYYDGKTDMSGVTLRHEIQHLHDKNLLTPKNSYQEARDEIVWTYNKIRHGKEWDKELANAGLFNDSKRAYALTKECEKRSVTSESDMSKLSQKYKDDLIKHNHMQPWIFNLKKNPYIPEKSMLPKEVTDDISSGKAPKVEAGIFSKSKN